MSFSQWNVQYDHIDIKPITKRVEGINHSLQTPPKANHHMKHIKPPGGVYQLPSNHLQNPQTTASLKLLELPYLFEQESPTFALQVVTFLQPAFLLILMRVLWMMNLTKRTR